MSTPTAHGTRSRRVTLTHTDGAVTCRPAVTADDLAAHHAIRRAVFVEEQRIFAGDDHDEHDDASRAIHLLGRYNGLAAGAVRLFPLDEAAGLWQGDRLCVLPPFRTRGLGAPLVRCAVASAGARGGRSMVAHIQLPNVRFFAYLGWRPEGEIEMYAGQAHQRMVIDLPAPEDGARTEQELFAGVRG